MPMPVLFDQLGALADFVQALLLALGLLVLSLVGTSLFARSAKGSGTSAYLGGIACFGLSQGLLLRRGLEQWRGAMWDWPRQAPVFSVLPLLSIAALVLIVRAPSIKKGREARPPLREP
jgi:hypothetical protein